MSTGLVYDDRYLEHDTGSGHPERADRLKAVVEGLESRGLMGMLKRIEATKADMDAVLAVHDDEYVRRLCQACREGRGYIDTQESVVCPGSFEVAMLAAGGVLAAVDAVMRAEVNNVFCAVRPPGHHAEQGRSMGFCLLNNIAIAAEHLVRQHGLRRVAILDFDVHHGNGTQHTFQDREDVLFVSMHEDPRHLYPGSGFADEVGQGAGVGRTLNLPLEPGGGDDAYLRVLNERVLPALSEYQPEILLVSAGFDAAADDPLAHMRVTEHGFGEIARLLKGAAAEHGGGRMVSVLEGGYDLESLRRCVAAYVEAMLREE